jgi:SAM-dependent methyltransferase
MRDPKHFAPAGPVRGLAYRLLWGCSDTLHSAANACVCVAAGLMRQADLEANARLLWREYFAADDEVDFGLDRWERRVYTEILRPSDRVLLIGSGTGRDLLGLRELGYDVTGLESVPELVELSRQRLARRGVTATVLAGPVQTVELGGRYDAILFSSGVYSYLPGMAARVATLERLEDHLSSDGRLLVSYLTFVGQSPLSRWLTGVSARLAHADWKPEPGDIFSRDRVASRAVRYEHGFLPDEVASECTAAGLRVVRDRLESQPFRCAVAVR